MVQLDLYYIPRPHITGGSKLTKITLIEMVLNWMASSKNNMYNGAWLTDKTMK